MQRRVCGWYKLRKEMCGMTLHDEKDGWIELIRVECVKSRSVVQATPQNLVLKDKLESLQVREEPDVGSGNKMI